MSFKGKPSINKRNRESALQARQKEKALARSQRAIAKENAVVAPGLPGETAEERELREFQEAMNERKAADAAEAELDAARRR